ncbi:hypothetical protein WMF45_32975 [Sorangium sp. So ce448]|uniref:hypothetical protein n=1 Tax=unclassified Sorangium TaxID=2621164 RepID=UPI0002D6D915
MSMYKALALGSVLLAILGHGAPASAQEKGKQRGVITLAEVTITGRIQKPIAAVDVSRIQPKLTLAELRQPFLDRIEQAIFKEPF